MLTIFGGLVFTLFDVEFPFRFPRAVGESGKRKWGTRRSGRVMSEDTSEIKVG